MLDQQLDVGHAVVAPVLNKNGINFASPTATRASIVVGRYAGELCAIQCDASKETRGEGEDEGF